MELLRNRADVMEVLQQYLQTASPGRAEEEKDIEALSRALQHLIGDSIHAEFRQGSACML